MSEGRIAYVIEPCAKCGGQLNFVETGSKSGRLKCARCGNAFKVVFQHEKEKPESETRDEKLKAVLCELSDEALEELSKKYHAVSLRTHTFAACMSALDGIDVDIEISRRAREKRKGTKNE